MENLETDENDMKDKVAENKDMNEQLLSVYLWLIGLWILLVQKVAKKHFHRSYSSANNGACKWKYEYYARD